MLVQYTKQLFDGPEFPECTLQSTLEHMMGDDRWYAALLEVKAGKAVPSGAPPIEAWKQNAAVTASVLGAIARRHLCVPNPAVPGQWCEVQLAWLPKPYKTPCIPSNLRNIGIMATDTKTFMTVLKNLILPHVKAGFFEIPQFAYRLHAGMPHAIMCGAHHCRLVRDAVAHARSDATSRLTGLSTTGLRGGIMLSLDLAKAFDSVTFQEMYVSLRECNVDDSVARLLIEVHKRTTRTVRHCMWTDWFLDHATWTTARLSCRSFHLCSLVRSNQ